jgi:hypothetical protein
MRREPELNASRSRAIVEPAMCSPAAGRRGEEVIGAIRVYRLVQLLGGDAFPGK